MRPAPRPRRRSRPGEPRRRRIGPASCSASASCSKQNFDELARLIVRENGKLLSEARGSLRRGIDVVEFACGIPSQLMGQTLPDVSRDVDSYVVHEPLGVVVGIPPFNFPAMIPLWMMPIAVACGNSFILKPAEKAPLTGTPTGRAVRRGRLARRRRQRACRAARKSANG